MPIPVCLPDGGKIAKSFTCLFASFTLHLYGSVLCTTRSCILSSLFSGLDDFDALAHLLAPHCEFGFAIGNGMDDESPGRIQGWLSRTHLKGSWAASTIPLTALQVSCHSQPIALFLFAAIWAILTLPLVQ